MKFGIVVFPGSNCDRDMYDALHTNLHQTVQMLWHKVTATAVVNGAYHLYAQDAGGGVGLPTKFKFNKNPLLTLVGTVAEGGKLITAKENLGDKKTVTVRYYKGTVTFTQTVKAKVASNLSGNVTYMVCNDTGCLPPSTTSFDIKL